MTQWLEPVTLRNAHAILEPLNARHHDDLVEAVGDGDVWRLWYTRVPAPEALRGEIARRLSLHESDSMLPFAVLDPRTGRAVGMTTFMNADPSNRRIEIGSTWYRKSAQRTALNTACKLLLLEHAFERLACVAVELRTSSHNHPSRRAIERLGASLDGILRHHGFHSDGTLRDTCVYSIVADEWPNLRANLASRLAPGDGTRNGAASTRNDAR